MSNELRRWITLLEDPSHPAFAAWFAGSQVVEANGDPQIVCHGTAREFKAFRPMTHFGTAGAAQDRLRDLSAEGKIIGVYLAIKKPLLFSDKGWQHSPAQMLNDLGGCWRMYEASDLEDDEIDDMLNKMYGARSYAPIVRFLISMGYDGLQYENLVEDRGSTSWTIFNAKQVWRVGASKPG